MCDLKRFIALRNEKFALLLCFSCVGAVGAVEFIQVVAWIAAVTHNCDMAYLDEKEESTCQSNGVDDKSEILESTKDEEATFLDSEPIKVNHGPKFGKRHEQVICNFFLMFIAYSIRVSLSVAIVAMTDSNTSSNKDILTFNWTDKSVILSAFFWGYILPQVGAGWLASQYGPKWFLVVSMAVCSISGFFLPILAVHFGSKGVMVCRAVQGLCQGFIYPSVHSLLAKWVPRNERSLLANLLYAGGPCGTVVSMVMTGYISESSYGWPMVFYLFSSLGLVWCVVFTFIGSNGPAQHTSITVEERMYIERSLGQRESTEKISTPWLRIFSSLPFWALILTQCGFIWGFWTLLTETPIYMNKVMKFDLKSNSILSSLPHISHWFFGSFFGYISDLLINKNIMSVEACRKMMTTIGYMTPAVALIFLGNCREDDYIQALILLIVIVGINAASLSGFFINHVDLSPNHAGLLMGICNGFANICAIVAPLLVQVLVTDEEDPRQWSLIFYIAAAIYVATNAIFFFFGSVNIQQWNDNRNEIDMEHA